MESITPFQGGLPPIRTRSRQHGTGFFSSLKRFIIPVAKTILPHLFGGVSDVVTGKATPLQALKRRGANLAHDVVHQVVDPEKDVHTPPPAKRPKSHKSKWQQQQQKKKKPGLMYGRGGGGGGGAKKCASRGRGRGGKR